jgi:hypothetical protein
MSAASTARERTSSNWASVPASCWPKIFIERHRSRHRVRVATAGGRNAEGWAARGRDRGK